MTTADKMFMEGSENAFPSNEDQERSKSTDREGSDQEEVEDEKGDDLEEEGEKRRV
jgi:hypothetical protein